MLLNELMTIKGYVVTLISYLLRPAKRKCLKLAFRHRRQTGLEIGGPSSFFHLQTYFPVYFLAHRIDGVNFSSETVWEGTIKEGETYRYFKDKIGTQFIDEASELKSIGNDVYDFVLSCHSLEHIANPVKALMEWKRVLKAGGSLVLVLPDKRYTFDHKRNYTSFEHLLDDYKNKITEHDNTHFQEVLALHDRTMDAGLAQVTSLESRLQQNYLNRCVHHHVFSQELVRELLTYCGFTMMHQQELSSFHLVAIAKKNDG